MKPSEIRELPADELAQRIRSAKEELEGLRRRMASKVEVDKPAGMRGMRREIARMLTIQAEKARAAAEAKK